MACGMTDVGRKRICDRISRAIRAAAFQAVDLGRAQHAAQARQEAALADSVGLADEPELGSDGEAGDDDGGALSDSDDDMDRGSWSLAPRVGQHVAREAQGAAHKAVVAARKAAGAAARLAALEAERAAAALTAASLTAAEAAAAHAARPGRFGRAEAGKSGGRAIHFLSGDGRTTGTSWPVLAAWLERCADTNGNEKHWARVDAWWSWSRPGVAGSGTRFAGLAVASCDPGADLVCQSWEGGSLCGASALRRPSLPRAGVPVGKARCMAHRLSATASLDSAACGPLAQGAASPGTPAGKHCRSLHCELCGASAHEVTEGWCSIGRWSVVCGDCRPRVTPVNTDRTCGGGCGSLAVGGGGGKGGITPDGSWGCPACAGECTRPSVWLARAWRLLPLALRWLGVTPTRIPLPDRRRFCVRQALAWEAAGRAYSPGASPFPGDALEWADMRLPLAAWLHELGVWDGAAAAAGADAPWSTCLGLRPDGPVPAWAEEPEDDPQPAEAPAPTLLRAPAPGAPQRAPRASRKPDALPGRRSQSLPAGAGRLAARAAAQAPAAPSAGPRSIAGWLRAAAPPLLCQRRCSHGCETRMHTRSASGRPAAAGPQPCQWTFAAPHFMISCRVFATQ